MRAAPGTSSLTTVFSSNPMPDERSTSARYVVANRTGGLKRYSMASMSGVNGRSATPGLICRIAAAASACGSRSALRIGQPECGS